MIVGLWEGIIKLELLLLFLLFDFELLFIIFSLLRAKNPSLCVYFELLLYIRLCNYLCRKELEYWTGLNYWPIKICSPSNTVCRSSLFLSMPWCPESRNLTSLHTFYTTSSVNPMCVGILCCWAEPDTYALIGVMTSGQEVDTPMNYAVVYDYILASIAPQVLSLQVTCRTLPAQYFSFYSF